MPDKQHPQGLPQLAANSILCLAILLLAPNVGAQPECAVDDECGPGFFCREGECDDTCEGEGTACPGDYWCDGEFCTECAEDTHCLSHAEEALDCPDCHICDAGLCEVGCDDALNPCGEDAMCHERRCVQCVGDGDCSEGTVCLSNRCVACNDDSHCGEGLQCVLNACVACAGDADCSDPAMCVGGLCVDCEAECAVGECSAACTPVDCSDRVFETIYFDYDESAIRASEEERLLENVWCLRQFPTEEVLISGHTDERGSEEFNQNVAERQARAVRRYLERMGIDGDRLSTISYGESRPICRGHDEACWRLNRRVEINWQ